eukprot:gene8342-10247_t
MSDDCKNSTTINSLKSSPTTTTTTTTTIITTLPNKLPNDLDEIKKRYLEDDVDNGLPSPSSFSLGYITMTWQVYLDLSKLKKWYSVEIYEISDHSFLYLRGIEKEDDQNNIHIIIPYGYVEGSALSEYAVASESSESTNTTTSGCAAYESCSKCMDDKSCVWCSGDAVCTDGTFYGSKPLSTCKDFMWMQCKIQGRWAILIAAGGVFLLLVVFVTSSRTPVTDARREEMKKRWGIGANNSQNSSSSWR